ncbi:MAG: hypothetical protein AMXMBFR23_20070 [Chloroflexota bacterium]
MTRILMRRCDDCDTAPESVRHAPEATRCSHGRRLRVTVRLERPRTR